MKLYNKKSLHVFICKEGILTLKVPEKLQLYGFYVYYMVHICEFGMLRVKGIMMHLQALQISMKFSFAGGF